MYSTPIVPTGRISRRVVRRGSTLLAAAAAVAVLASPLVAVSAASATGAGPVTSFATEESVNLETTECTIDEATLTWGVRETFRAYISGSIAHGGWETSGGAEYETPNFFWPNGVGAVNSDLSEGAVDFTGSVRFSGHENLLRFDIGNPSIVFDGDAAYLELDTASSDTGETGDLPIVRVRAAKLDLASSLGTSEQTVTISDAVVRLTADGAEAFNGGGYGDYASGDELDPISLVMQVSGCTLAPVTPAEVTPDAVDPVPEATTQVTPAVPAETQVPWVPIIVGGIAILVIAVAGTMLVRGSKRGATDAGDSGAAGEVSAAEPPAAE